MLLLLSILLQLCFFHYFWKQMGDDSFIFFRYAQNFAASGELVWNVGGNHVEGYSSPLWTLLLSLFVEGQQIVVGSQLLGLLCTSGALYRVWQLSNSSIVSLLGAMLGMGVQYWASSGLETSLYSFLFLSTLLAMKRKASLVWIVFFSLCRPESGFLAVIAILLIRERKMREWLLLLPIICYVAFRMYYFGEVLPNTYFAKATGEPIPQIIRGALYSVLPLLALIVFWAKQNEKRQLILPTFLLLIIIGGGGDWMWHDRLLVPLYLFSWAVLSNLCGFWKIGVGIVLIQMWMPFFMVKDALLGKELPDRLVQEGNLITVSKAVAESIQNNIKEGATIAVNHAGVLPFYLPQHNFLDMTGLNDAWIAKSEGGLHQKYDIEYVFQKEPDLIVLNSFHSLENGFVPDYWEGERELFVDSRFQERYVPIAQAWERLSYQGGKAYIVLFQKRKQQK